MSEKKNPFLNPKVQRYYHELGETDMNDEWHAIVTATAMIVTGSLVLLLGLAWWLL